MRLILPVLFVMSLLQFSYASDSWDKILEEKKGTVTFYWYPNNIVITESRDILDGIEHELAEAFIRYLNNQYQVDIKLVWIETDSFQEVMETVKNGQDGIFGASSISITEERGAYLNFTPSYLSDIAVLVSNARIPIIQTAKEFNREFDGKTAVTIANTTLNQSLDRLAREEGLEFKKSFVNNSGDIIQQVERDPNAFGYIDLPNFLIGLKKNAKVRRQFFHPYKLEGLAYIFPKTSDWDVPVKDYFNSGQYAFDKERIVRKYLGEDVTSTIAQIAKSAEMGPLEEIVISHREKEMQFQELLNAAKREQRKTQTNTMLIVLSIVVTFSLLIVFIQYRIKLKVNQKLLEQQLVIEQSNQQLQQLNKDKNDLISLLVHDLRSPLNRIMGISQLFKSKKVLPKDHEHLNDICVDSSRRMSEMITKILDVEAIESGKHNVKLELVNIRLVIESVCRDFNALAQQKSITLLTVFEPELKVMADKVYIVQVLENLLSNAIKFSNKSSEVKISTQSVNDYVRISVTDQGPGIKPEDENKLFKKYQTLSAQPTAGESSVGLGLIIVKQYTELMGGKANYQSQPGEGATFYVDLVKA